MTNDRLADVIEGLDNQSRVINDRLAAVIEGVDNQSRLINDRLAAVIEGVDNQSRQINDRLKVTRTQSDLIDLPDLPIIHVGFAHSGTTSLQENIFSKRTDLFYAGVPYAGVRGDLGGIFSLVKYREPGRYDSAATTALAAELIFRRMHAGQRLVISDETLVDQPAIYYTPPMMHVALIAERLRALFGPARVLFTLRNPLHTVVSTYLTLKRNYAALANRDIEPFEQWFAGNLTQERNLFLCNLDPSLAIRKYELVFGEGQVNVLPLELLTRQGIGAYLCRLGEIMGLEFSPSEIDGYVARNVSQKHDILLTAEQRETIHNRSAAGNAWVAQRFGLPLAQYGYPMASV
jgi:hypothetical protein